MGLDAVELVRIGDLGEGELLVVVIRSRKARPSCEPWTLAILRAV